MHPGCQKTDFRRHCADTLHGGPDPPHNRALSLGPAGGRPWRSLATFAANRAADSQPVVFAFNGGMFDDDGQPIGYYVEGGERKHALNRATGPGNFHMLPNGVFYGSAEPVACEGDRGFLRQCRPSAPPSAPSPARCW